MRIPALCVSPHPSALLLRMLPKFKVRA